MAGLARTVERTDRRRTLLVGVVGWFCIAASSFGLAPLYPEISRDLGVGPETLGAILGLSSFASALGQIPAGVLADKVGLRAPLIAGLAATALAATLRGLSTGPWLFALGQVSIGLAIPTYQAGSITAVAEAYEGRGRGTAIALLFSAFNLGMISSVVIFGAIGSQLGWRTASLSLAFLPIIAAPFVRLLPEYTRAHRGKSVTQLITESVGFLRRRVALTLAAITILASTASVMNVFLMPFELRAHGLDAAQAGIVLASNVVGSVVGAPLVARLNDEIGIRMTLGAVFVLGAATVALLALTSGQIAAVVASLLVLGTCLGGVTALTQSSVAEEAARTNLPAAGALSGMRLAQSIGPGLAPTMAGFAYVRGGLRLAEVVAFAALCAAFAISRTLVTRHAGVALPVVAGVGE